MTDQIDYWSEYPRHIEIKHTILAHYLKIWVQHLGKNPEICYFGCFAGRGRHETGDEGSPIRVLRVINDVGESTNLTHAHCIFVEKDAVECARLKSELAKAATEYPFATVECVNAAFEDCVESLMAEHDVPGKPAFFFIDPFGYTGIPMHIVRQIMSFPRTEILFTFMISAVKRWLSLPNQEQNYRDLFGIQRIPDLSHVSGPLETWLVDLYEQQLTRAGNTKFVLRYKMCDDSRTTTLYYLIHATNSLTGCRKMKGVMGKQASDAGSPFAYLGPTEVFHKQSEFIFAGEEPRRLALDLLAHFTGRSVTFKKLIEETIMKNYCSESDYRDALKALLAEGTVVADGLGPRGGISDDAVFYFADEDTHH